MSNKRFCVISTGKLVAGADVETVKSNLILDIGLTDEKVAKLLNGTRVVLKRLPTAVEAQRLAERFERAGMLCVIEDQNPGLGGQQSSGESSLITIVNRFISASRRNGASSKTA